MAVSCRFPAWLVGITVTAEVALPGRSESSPRPSALRLSFIIFSFSQPSFSQPYFIEAIQVALLLALAADSRKFADLPLCGLLLQSALHDLFGQFDVAFCATRTHVIEKRR